MTRVLIVYHTISGNTEKMAKAFEEGAKSVPGTDVVVKKAFDADLEDLLARAVARVCDYFSYIAGALKDFFDRTYYPSKEKLDGKPYAAFATSGSGGNNALDVIDRLCGAFKLIKSASGVSAKGEPSSEILAKCREMGAELAKAAQK